jgi:hypothetical protein
MSKKKLNNITILEEEELMVPEKPKISFAHWFDKMKKAKKIRDWQEDGLLVFLKKQGLSDAEDEDSYNEAFKKF